jgi:tetratricopeptide (TPR) repeat protein
MSEDTPTLNKDQRADLRKKLAEHFDKEELRNLCFDLGGEHQDLPETLKGMARDLVKYCERAGTIPELLQKCGELRPKVKWPELPTEPGRPPIPPPPENEKVGKLLAEAQSLFEKRFFEDAIRLLKEARSEYPKNFDIEQLYVKVIYAKAVHLYVTERKLHTARLLFQEVVGLDPSYEGAARLLAEVEQQMQREPLPEVEQQMQRELWPRVQGRLRDPIWQWIGAMVTILACIVAIMAIPPVQRLLWPAATPTLTRTFTASPTPLMWITYPPANSQVAQYTTVMGEYPANLVDDLWVFVQEPDKGQYYLQTMSLQQDGDKCIIEGVIKRDGEWEMPVVLGDSNAAGKSYNIILASANLTVSQSISVEQRAFCKAGFFPGLPELPLGTTIQKSTRVVRGPDVGGPLPNLQSAGMLTGTVSVTNVTDRSRVPQTITITGTYDGIAGDIWVLVYDYNGRWYPQSIAPCIGDHIRMENGQWWSKVSFGGDQDIGRPFDIVVILANAEANGFLNGVQSAGCRNDYYPGVRTLQLPKGIEVKSRYRVYHR